MQRFKIGIAAVDEFTPTFAKANQAIGNLNKPIAGIEASFKKLAGGPALDSIGKSLAGVGASALDAVSAIGSLIPSIGVLAGLGSGAGILGFANSWNNAAADINRTARSIGITTTALQEWQFAARAAGLQTEAIDSGFSSLAATLENAVAGRNNEVLGLMTRLGIEMKTTADGAVDVASGLEDISAAFDRTRKGGIIQIGGVKMSGLEGAKNLAQTLGVGNLIPLLLQGQERINQFVADARGLGGIFSPEDAARAERYSQSINRLGAAASGTANVIGRHLTPSITGMSDALTNTLSDFNRGVGFLEKNKNNGMAFQVGAIAIESYLDQLWKDVVGGDSLKRFGAKFSAGGRAPETPYSIKPTGIGAGRSLLDLAQDHAALQDAAKRNPIITPAMAEIQRGQVSVDIRLHGAPAGTVASVSQSGNVDATARIETSMPLSGL